MICETHAQDAVDLTNENYILKECMWMLFLGHKDGKIKYDLFGDYACAWVERPDAECDESGGLPTNKKYYRFATSPDRALAGLYDQLKGENLEDKWRDFDDRDTQKRVLENNQRPFIRPRTRQRIKCWN